MTFLKVQKYIFLRENQQKWAIRKITKKPKWGGENIVEVQWLKIGFWLFSKKFSLKKFSKNSEKMAKNHKIWQKNHVFPE